MKKEILYILSVIIFAFAIISCETTEPPPSNQRITLTALDASSTEAWLNLKQENISLPTTIRLLQNDAVLSETNVNSNDTTLFIENLSPSQSFSFKVTNTKYQTSSNEVPVTTMDTTSHNFTWETFTFGGGSSSYFNDVAIINENDIWTVGEIHTEDTDKFDSNGVWIQPYNAVHWDGSKWELKRILVEYLGQPNFAPLHSVFSLPSGEIIFSSGLPYLPENNEWKLYHLWDMGVLDNNDGSVYKIWGTSIENLYFVGNKGTIVHYNGSNWTKIESGTENNIYGIIGTENNETKYCTPSASEYGVESYLLKIDGNNVTKEYLGTDRHFVGIWTKKGFPIYLSGDGTFSNKSGSWKDELPNNVLFTSDIEGNDLNDIITCGSSGYLAHYSCSSWKTYPVMISNWYSAVSIRENIVAAAGFSNNEATIVVGRRN